MWGIEAADLVTLSFTVALLVVLEGLLSADNALVLAVMVRHLPKHQQKRALRYGMLGAFGFRLIAVVFASTLLQYWILKVLGGVYLLYIAISHLAHGEDGPETERRSKFGNGFWGTVIGVEMTDIAFSVDSILAAVGTAAALPDRLGDKLLVSIPGVVDVDVRLLVIYIGGILGIVAMRFVAGYFLILLDRFQGLAVGAYYLVGWIGLKLFGGGLDEALHPRHFTPAPNGWRGLLPPWAYRVPLEMNPWFFWSGMALIVVGSLLYKPRGGSENPPGELVGSTRTHE
jgi:YkoY family integral membrane protein